MSIVVNKADLSNFRTSASWPDYDPAQWLNNPAGFAGLFDVVPSRYWKLTVGGDDIEEMTQGEKDAVDAALEAAALAGARAEAATRASLDIGTRSIFEGWLFEVNKCNMRLQEFQDAMTEMKGTATLATLRNAIPDPSATTGPAPSEWSRVNPKLRSDVLQKYVDDINAGTTDP